MSDRGDGGFGWFLFGFALGGVVGAAVALAYAPEKGEQTREILREKGIELQGQAQEIAGKFKDRLGELREQAEEQIEHVRHQVEEGMQAAQQYTAEMAERLHGAAAPEEITDEESV